MYRTYTHMAGHRHPEHSQTLAQQRPQPALCVRMCKYIYLHPYGADPPAAGLRHPACPAAARGPRCPQSLTSGRRTPGAAAAQTAAGHTDRTGQDAPRPAASRLPPETPRSHSLSLFMARRFDLCQQSHAHLWLLHPVWLRHQPHTSPPPDTAGKEPEEQTDRRRRAGPGQAGVLTSQPLTQHRLF